MKARTSIVRGVLALSLTAAVAWVSPTSAAPPPKQNGSSALQPFTSICGVPNYASYGNCGGDATTYANVTGRINVVQSKTGRYNLGFTFTNLAPGVIYRLWGTYGYPEFFSIGSVAADATGVAKFSYQTDAPEGLGFDLNIVSGDITVVTTYWSGHLLSVNPDGSLTTLG